MIEKYWYNELIKSFSEELFFEYQKIINLDIESFKNWIREIRYKYKSNFLKMK